MRSETQKLKASHEVEKKVLNEKYVKNTAKIYEMKQKLDEMQKASDEKKKVVTRLEAKILNMSETNNKISEGNERLTQDLTIKPYMGKKLVHFDLKGAPPKLNYLLRVMKYTREFGANGFLIEYEDMFPWDGELTSLRRKNAYTKDDIKQILSTAQLDNMMIVPLVQTFGHLEFLLKHEKFKHLRADGEITNVICPIHKGSVPLIKEMITQILKMHPHSTLIHLGGDEVYNLKTCEKCKVSNMSDFELYTHHMLPLFNHVKTIKTDLAETIKPIIWDDMLRKWDVKTLKMMAEHVTPMVWAYVPDLNNYHNFPDGMWDRFSVAFPTLWIASSFKGALKPWTNFAPVKHHLENHLSWLKIISTIERKGTKVVGVALTGWSRYDHYGPLCELLPAGIPSLALCLTVLAKGNFDNTIHEEVSKRLTFEKTFKLTVTNFKGYSPQAATYPGGRVYKLVGSLEKAIGWHDWSDVRITGWTRPYQKRIKFISFFQLNTTLFGLNRSMELLHRVKINAFDVLIPIFDEDTVMEWIEDKIDYHINLITASINNITRTINNYNFT